MKKHILRAVIAVAVALLIGACSSPTSSKKNDGTDGNGSTVTVTFDLNYSGSTGAPTAQSIDSGATATEPTAPTRTGYDFAGWYTDAAGTSSFSFSTAVSADTTLYAKWNYVLADFEGTAPTLGVLNYNAASGVLPYSSIKNYTSTGNSDGSNTKALLVMHTNYSALPTVTVTLPANLSTYKSLKVDFFVLTGNNAGAYADFKTAYLFAADATNGTDGSSATKGIADGATYGTTVGSNNLIAVSGSNALAGPGTWNTGTFDLSAAGNAAGQTLITALNGVTKLELGIGPSAARGSAYLIDNIRVVASDNTETTLENFEGTAPTIGVLNYNIKAGVIPVSALKNYTATGNANAGTNGFLVVNGNYNALPTITATMPANLSSYSAVKVRFFVLTGDGSGGYADYKTTYLFAANATAGTDGSSATKGIADGATYGTTVGSNNLIAASGSNALAGPGTWNTATFDLTATGNSAGQTLITGLNGATTLELGIGASTAAGGAYIIDNIELVQ